MVLAKSCFYDNTIKGYVRACKPWQYLQGSPSQKSLLEVYNVAFLIWVFINCQSRVRIPGFSSYVCIVMVYITLFYFHTFADARVVVILARAMRPPLSSRSRSQGLELQRRPTFFSLPQQPPFGDQSWSRQTQRPYRATHHLSSYAICPSPWRAAR